MNMLQLIVFFSGAVLMSLEMVGSRLLAPAFGASIYVWGSLIVVVMAALTLGYYCGGRISDQYPRFEVMGAILGIAGVFIGFLPLWTQPVNRLCSLLEPRAGSLLASLAFFFLPSVMLAAISPFGIKLTGRSLTTIGNTAGHMSAISTGGSIIGTLVTSFFLIPALGVRNIVHSLGVILLILSLLAFFTARRSQSARAGGKSFNLMILIVILSGGIVLALWRIVPGGNRLHDADEVLYDRDSLYHHITVDQIGSQRHLHFDNSYQSAINLEQPMEMAFAYTSYLHLGVVARPEPARALFIGLGGGSAPKKFLHDYPGLQMVEVVEIDPEVVKVAYDYFQLPENDPRLRVIVKDGRLYVEQKAQEITAGKTKSYDIVLIDAYSSSSIPYHLTTLEFVHSVRKVLSPNGVVVSNIIGALTGTYSKLLLAMKHTFDQAFLQTYLFPVGIYGGPNDITERNVILVATMDAKRWDKQTWLNKAENLYNSGAITELVAAYAGALLDETRMGNWMDKIPILTDDYAPVDTLKNPL
ncbi:MAG: fused MFS/spermidine synthase [Firmicutes bacterium]|nr:fused MFS/spermidine synthase [Bacillota bacterium]